MALAYFFCLQYRKGQMRYEQDRKYNKLWKHDRLFQILKMHFPEFNPEIIDHETSTP